VKIKILIVDDYNIFRNGLKLLIESNSAMQVTGEVSNQSELFKMIEIKQPDVVVIALALAENQVINFIKRLVNEYSSIPFVLLIFNAEEPLILECIKLGTKGILWKNSTPEQLIEAIETVASGGIFLNVPESKIKSKIIRHAYNNHPNSFDFTTLSERETEVLVLFGEGLSYKEIADKLNISPRTVESHKKNILSKLKLHSIADMIKYAIKHDLIEI